MGKKSVPPPPSKDRSKPVRTEDRVGGHLSINVKDVKRQMNATAPGGEGAAIVHAHIMQSLAERWLSKAAEASEGHLKGEEALVHAVQGDELLRCLLGEIVGVTLPVPGDDEIVTNHIESLAAKRAAKAEAERLGAAAAGSPVAEA